MSIAANSQNRPFSPPLRVHDEDKGMVEPPRTSPLEPLFHVVSTGCLSPSDFSCVFPHAFSNQFWNDFDGQAFHLNNVVEEQVELDKFGTRISYLAQTCDEGKI